VRRNVVRVCFAAAVLLWACQARATVSMCTSEQAERNGYGPKAAMRLDLGEGGMPAFLDALKAYAPRAGMYYHAGGVINAGPSEILMYGLQYYDITIHVTHKRGSRVAKVQLVVFSDGCGAPDDWKPYWRNFEAFVSKMHYKRLPREFSLHN
jgi:hypothetical protein